MSNQLTADILHAYLTGDESGLRASSEGRQFLVGVRKEQRRIPLPVRRAPRLAGQQMARTIDQVTLEVLRA